VFHNLQKGGGGVWFTCACEKNRYCMQIKHLDLKKKDHENVGIDMIQEKENVHIVSCRQMMLRGKP
jgi:hypothetical protein